MTRAAETLSQLYGSLLIVRPPVPATVNRAGANYKSEVAHLHYSPRRAYDEWLAICDGILACGGDALFDFEEADEPLLDCDQLELAADGAIRARGSAEARAHIDDVATGRVFTANGPWVTMSEGAIRALMPKMLVHRRAEHGYYRDLLERIAEIGGHELTIEDGPHPWEGMADVAAVGDAVVLTYTVSGHYDAGLGAKSMRSSRAGVEYAADFAGIPRDRRVLAELTYPHFHGDTVHFCARPRGRPPVLVAYPGGLWGDGASRVAAALGAGAIVEIDRADAVDAYAANSRQVGDGLLVPAGVSDRFLSAVAALGLTAIPIALHELFGKAGGGPACATLHLPASLTLPADAPIRYSVARDRARARRERIPEQLVVDPRFFAGASRG